MERFEVGMLAVSRAGHDRGCLYVIGAIDDEYVYLTDGRLRTPARPKKKKKKHIQVVQKIPEELSGLPIEKFKNEDIKRAIKHYQESLSQETMR